MHTRTRWGVVVDRLRKFVGHGHQLNWTHDRVEAERIARSVGGRVVDALAWARSPTFLVEPDHELIKEP